MRNKETKTEIMGYVVVYASCIMLLAGRYTVTRGILGGDASPESKTKTHRDLKMSKQKYGPTGI